MQFEGFCISPTCKAASALIHTEPHRLCSRRPESYNSLSLSLRGQHVGPVSLAQPLSPPAADGASAGQCCHLVCGRGLCRSAGGPSAAARSAAAPGQLREPRARWVEQTASGHFLIEVLQRSHPRVLDSHVSGDTHVLKLGHLDSGLVSTTEQF